MSHLNTNPKKRTNTHFFAFLAVTFLILLSGPAAQAQNPAETAQESFTRILSVKPDASSPAVFTPGQMDLSMKMGAAKVTGCWSRYTLSAIYHYEKNAFELGFVSQAINELLPGEMKMELKASPDSGDALVLFSIDL